MPAPHPPEFRKRAVELARLREKPVSEIAADLGEGAGNSSTLQSWVFRR
jgi:transposase